MDLEARRDQADDFKALKQYSDGLKEGTVHFALSSVSGIFVLEMLVEYLSTNAC